MANVTIFPRQLQNNDRYIYWMPNVPVENRTTVDCFEITDIGVTCFVDKPSRKLKAISIPISSMHCPAGNDAGSTYDEESDTAYLSISEHKGAIETEHLFKQGQPDDEPANIIFDMSQDDKIIGIEILFLNEPFELPDSISLPLV